MDLETQESQINFIPCIKWVKKGVASTNPQRVQLSKHELVQIIKDTQEKLRTETDGEDVDMEQNESADQYNFDKYDEDEAGTASTLGISSLAELPEGEVDDNFSESDDSEKEDDVIRSSDSLILVGHVEGDASILEVHVYNEEEESFYVHHDILLPAFPLCLEWLNYETNTPNGNYCAIGSMSPIIEVWDLDVVNCIEPAFKLGQKANRKKNRQQIGHKDAVLSLAWNKNFDHILASGSVDKTILLWDMENQTPNTKITAFNNKIQCLEWHLLESQTLLAGGCDQTAKVFDCRTPEPHQTWQLSGEAEKLQWHPQQPFNFLAGTSTGQLQYFDCRKGQLWSVEAHTKEVTGLTVSTQCPGLMVTSSPDGLIKIWDIDENDATCISERNFGLGMVHCLDLCPDLPFVIAAGGDKKSKNLLVYDLQNIDLVKERFGTRSLVQLVPDNN